MPLISDTNRLLETIAKQFGYNSAYLGKLFAKETGRHFNVYLDERRIELAKDYLEKGISVAQTCELTGFANTDYFENGFPVEIVIQNGSIYWIYEKKVVRVPGCSRCEDPEAEVATVPICLEDHYCRKCSKLLTVRSAFEDAIESVQPKPEI